ncbi:hypothetical protein F2Q70_00001762 [Brassica cretica]|uniref:Uncharacterized protein n=1 Tax=Brassica cretica TaxID=69181 RepID=A0A8S9IPP6_BRACR|nr:hypothetical protein F2Q70_00001762 [Brassica cretica]
MKKIFWKIAKAYTVAEYDEGIEEMRQYVLGVYETLMEKNPQTCSRAYFTGTACYEVVHNNFSETYNNTINTAREMPLVEMLETIRRLAMVRTDFRKEKMKKHKGKYSKKVAKTIEEESKHKNNCRAVAGANGQFDVRENNLGHSGHMTRRTCTCRKCVAKLFSHSCDPLSNSKPDLDGGDFVRLSLALVLTGERNGRQT